MLARLANGVPVAVLPSTAPLVAVSMWMSRGARDDEPPGAGISHVLEHVLMTARRGGDASPAEQLEELGAYANAVTSTETLCLFAEVDPAGAGRAVDVLAGALVRGDFDDEDVVRERTAVVNELEARRRETDFVLEEAAFDAVFPGHPVGAPRAGRARLVALADADGVRAAHAERVGVGAVGALVVGSINADEVVALLDRGPLGRLSRPARVASRMPPPPPAPVPPAAAEPPVAGTGHQSYGWAARGPALADGDRIAYEVLAQLLAGGTSSLLDQEVRARAGVAYDIDATVNPLSDCGLFLVSVSCADRSVAEVHRIVTATLRRLADGGVPGSALTFATRKVATDRARMAGDPLLLTAHGGRHVFVAGRTGWSPSDDIVAARGVSAVDVARAAAAVLATGVPCRAA